MRTPFAEGSPTNIPPPDEAAHHDRVFMAEIGKLNEQVGRYLLRHLDADAGRADPVSVIEERALADVLSTLASKVYARANSRVELDAPPAIESKPTLRQLPSGRSTER